jgi:hypothetical protein
LGWTSSCAASPAVIGLMAGTHRQLVLSVSVWPSLRDDEVVALKVQDGFGDCFRDQQVLWDLAVESLLPKRSNHLRGRSLAHQVDDAGGSQCSGVRKAFQDDGEADEVVAVAVGDIDRAEVPVGGRHPSGQYVRLGGGHERADQNGAPFAHD